MNDSTEPDPEDMEVGGVSPQPVSTPYGGARPKVNVKPKERGSGSRKSPKTTESYARDFNSKHGSPVNKKTRGIDRTSSSDSVMFINKDENFLYEQNIKIISIKFALPP